MTLALTVQISTPDGAHAGWRSFSAHFTGDTFIILDRDAQPVARGDLLGESVPVIVSVEHDAPSLRGVQLPTANLARAVTVALERQRRNAA